MEKDLKRRLEKALVILRLVRQGMHQQLLPSIRFGSAPAPAPNPSFGSTVPFRSTTPAQSSTTFGSTPATAQQPFASGYPIVKKVVVDNNQEEEEESKIASNYNRSTKSAVVPLPTLPKSADQDVTFNSPAPATQVKKTKNNEWRNGTYRVECRFCGVLRCDGNGIAIHEKSCKKNPQRKHHIRKFKPQPQSLMIQHRIDQLFLRTTKKWMYQFCTTSNSPFTYIGATKAERTMVTV